MDPTEGREPVWLRREQIFDLFGISDTLFDRDWRPRLPPGAIRGKARTKKVEVDAGAVYQMRVRQLAEQWARGAASGDEGELKLLKLQEEIAKLQNLNALLSRDIAQRDREHVPTRELRILFGTLGQLTRQACVQAEKQFGEEGRELFQELWRALERNFKRLTGEIDDGVSLCRKRGRSWKPVDLAA